MSNLKITGMAFFIGITSVIIASFLGSFTESPLDYTIFVLAIVIASVYSVYKQKHMSFFTVCAIACIVILMSSCSTTRQPITIKVFYKSFGDPRWDDCKDIYTQEYSINIFGDTLESQRIYSLDCYEGRMKTFADKNQLK
jgi:hypothetical protein